LQIG